jgi:nitrogen fixation NifU-like protein
MNEMDSMIDQLYCDEILDLARNSPHRGDLNHPDLLACLSNPLCGDELTIALKLAPPENPDDTDPDHRRIEAFRFVGHGCAISQAAVELLAEHLEGRTLAEARAFSERDLLDLLGLPLTPARLKCGLLGLRALKRALDAEARDRSR